MGYSQAVRKKTKVVIFVGSSIYPAGSVTLVGATGKNKSIGLKARCGHRRAFPGVVPCQDCSCVDAGGRNGVKAQKLAGQLLICIWSSPQRANPAELVVDVGCGSGQGTRFLAAHFKKVVGTDISEAQIQEARDAPSLPNVSYL